MAFFILQLYCAIKCAPEIFQRLMTEVLKGLQNVSFFDILIFSTSKARHEKHVNAVLDRLEQRGLAIDFQKSTFGASEINYLGHKLSYNCVIPNKSNASAIKNFKPQKIKKTEFSGPHELCIEIYSKLFLHYRTVGTAD